jgi:hypothetical protein
MSVITKRAGVAYTILLPIFQMGIAAWSVHLFLQRGAMSDIYVALFFAWASGYRSAPGSGSLPKW